MNQVSKIVILIAVLILAAILWFTLGRDNNAEIVSNIESRGTEKSEFTIIAFGDSLTAGYGLPANESYPAKLEQALKDNGKSVTVINSGVSGETTRGNLERATFIREQNPDVVLLGIGGNDALRFLPVTETEKNIEATVNILKSGTNPPVVILLGMQAPLNAGLAYKNTFDALYEKIALKYDLILLPFITAELFLNRDYKLSDGIHFNGAGYQRIVELYLLPTVLEVVESMGN